MNEHEQTVGWRIRSLRSGRGISLRSLSRSLGVSPATLSNIECGRVGVSVGRLEAIAALLGVQAVDLFSGQSQTDMVPAAVEKPVKIETAPDFSSVEQIEDWRHYEPLRLDPVLAASLSEFLRAGYHGTSVRDIARAAGLSVSGMYHHYESKQEMLFRLLQIGTTELLQRSQAALSDGKDPVERFCHLTEHLVLWHCYRRDIGFVGASEMRSLALENIDQIVEMRRRQQTLIDNEVDSAVADGVFSTTSPHDAARAVVTMCVAIPTWYDPDGHHTPETIAAQYVEIALGAMGARGVPNL